MKVRFFTGLQPPQWNENNFHTMQESLYCPDVSFNTVVGAVPTLLELLDLVKLVPLFGASVRFKSRGGARLTDTVGYTADRLPPKAHSRWSSRFLLGCSSATYRRIYGNKRSGLSLKIDKRGPLISNQWTVAPMGHMTGRDCSCVAEAPAAWAGLCGHEWSSTVY